MENALYLATLFVVAPVLLAFGWDNVNREPTTYYSGATPETPTWEPVIDAQNTLPPTYAHELAE